MRYIFIPLIILLTAYAQAASLTAQVISIIDGDTITILTPAKQQIKVRLADIDAPELRGQPYGRKAKQVLSDKIYRQQVTVVQVSTDRYQRLVGRIFLDGRNINAEMVADGAAWVYRKYSDDPELLELERQAREEGRGLWALQGDQRVAPWEWRKKR
ncbi:MAG: thermonuclease family protein [Gammaproteobacteria bacterium]|nr:thermonuclease family protein [Gammaproteobacteria bacterium]